MNLDGMSFVKRVIAGKRIVIVPIACRGQLRFKLLMLHGG
jgi:hypothetical protein